MRKAQITAFILAGVIILIIFASLWYVVQNIQTKTQQQFTPEGFVQHCLKLGSEKALQILGRHSKVPDLPRIIPPASPEYCVSLTTQQDALLLDSMDNIQNDLPVLINTEFRRCLGDFEVIKKQGYQVLELQQPDTEVTFTPDKLVVETNYDVEFRKGSSVEVLNPLYLSMQSEYKDIHKRMNNTARQYIRTGEIPTEQFNTFPQTVLVAPDQYGILVTAIDESSNLYQPVNYTFLLE